MEQVRKHHNLVKRNLIQNVVGQGTTPVHILDVGCGFGGDLHKWFSLKRKIQLDMCDPNEEAIIEAKNRIKTLSYEKHRINIIHGDIFSCPVKKYDYICYNFSLHYIFKNAKFFFQSLNEITRRLKPGGILFGCIPDSEQVLLKTPYQDSMGNFFVRDMENTGFGNFGEKLFVQLADTPFYNDGPKPEPIAYKDMLITHLELKGMRLLNWEPIDSQWDVSKLYSQFIFICK